MKQFKYILFAMALFVNSFLKAQIPVNDAAWILQTSSSEEFNSTLDTISKWRAHYPWGNYNNGAEYNYPSNLIQTGTTLKIKLDTLTSGVYVTPSGYATPPSAGVTYAYQGGVISSMQTGGVERYKFGYLEGYAKTSTLYYCYWPCLWLFSCGTGFYNEIDFFEPIPDNCYDGDKYGAVTHLAFTSGCSPTASYPQTISNLASISTFHKYATEWAPDRVNWYFDDKLVRTLYDPTGVLIPQNPMMAIINFAVAPVDAFLPSNWNTFLHGNKTPTQWPAYLEIDYLRYYKLNVDCNTNLTICTPVSDYTSRAVKKTIVTGGACSPTFNTSDGYTLRATDYVTLDSGTTISDNGSGYFAVITMACPQ